MPGGYGYDDGNFKKGRFNPVVILVGLLAVAGAGVFLALGFKQDAEKLTVEQRTWMLACVLKTPLLTPEGRTARVRCLVELGARLRFEVVSPPRRRVSLRPNIDVRPP
jgi:hypothetical protein